MSSGLVANVVLARLLRVLLGLEAGKSSNLSEISATSAASVGGVDGASESVVSSVATPRLSPLDRGLGMPLNLALICGVTLSSGVFVGSLGMGS